MTAISITDLNNAKTDVDHIAAISTSVALTATDRLGNVKDTLTGAMYKVAAFNSRGAWATATVYAIKDLVSNAGTWYVCVVAHTSSAAFATDTATKWRVYQGVTSADLAASSGSSLVGYQSGTVDFKLTELVLQVDGKAVTPPTVTCYGDSFTMGLSGGITYGQAFVSLIAAAKNWSIPVPAGQGSVGVPAVHTGNQAYGGSQICSQEELDRIMAHTTTDADVQFILTGFNDMRAYGSSANGLSTYQQTLAAALAWMCIPETSEWKLYANSSNASLVLRTGTGWAANASWFNGKGYHTNVLGDAFNFTVYGDTIYLALPRDPTTTGLCSITVDGVNYGEFNFSNTTAAVQYSWARNMGFVRITGLSRSNHGVILTKTSATSGTDFMRIDWVAGVVGAQGVPDALGGPQVYVGNSCRMTTAGYASGGPSYNFGNDLVVSQYNLLIEQIVRDFASDGMNIVYVDASKYFDPNTMVAADGVHPNPAGHVAIANAFLEKMDQRKVHPKDRGMLERMQKFIRQVPTTSSLRTVAVHGGNGGSTMFGDGGTNTSTSYNIKLVESKFYRIDTTKHSWMIVEDSSASGPYMLYKAPGSGAISSWDKTIYLDPSIQMAWVAPTLLNSWVNFGAPWITSGYMKDTTGFVHLSGLVKSGAIAAALFVLPVGYRPAAKIGFPIVSNNAFGWVSIDASGTVVIEAGSNVFASLDGITFKV